jgi:predicted ribosomally synthesized peptide with nif11-like leader
VKRVEELFRKAATDKELQQALQGAATPEAKRDVLAQAGYGDITLDDLKAAAADLAQREELTDEEMEMVAGGTASGAAWASAAPQVIGASAGLGAALGGPVGAGIGFFVGVGVVIAAVTMIPDPPPPSEW